MGIQKIKWKSTKRDIWLAQRQEVGGVGNYEVARFGSSEVSTIMGYNKWQSRQKLFWNSLGLYMTSFHSFKMEMGLRYEQVNKESFECWMPNDKDGFDERFCTGKRLRKLQSPKYFLLNDKYPHSSSSLDYVLPKGQVCPFTGEVVTKPRPVETKFVNFNSYSSWKGVPPLYYVSQIQHQIAMLESDAGYLSVIAGGDMYDCMFLERDDVFIEYMDYTLQEWHVRILQAKSIKKLIDEEELKNDPDQTYLETLWGMLTDLEPVSVESDLEFVNDEMYPETNALEMQGDDSAQDAIDRYLGAMELENEAKKQKAIARTDITKIMKDFEILKTPNGNKVINRRGEKSYFKLT